jgi:hypothetical protein
LWRPLSLFEAALARNCRGLQSGRRGEAPFRAGSSYFFFNLERSSVAMNKRKRVAITKHRAKKKKLKAKLAGAK